MGGSAAEAAKAAGRAEAALLSASQHSASELRRLAAEGLRAEDALSPADATADVVHKVRRKVVNHADHAVAHVRKVPSCGGLHIEDTDIRIRRPFFPKPLCVWASFSTPLSKTKTLCLVLF